MFILAESQVNTVTLSTLSVPLTSGNVVLGVIGRVVICTRKRTSSSMTVVQLELLTCFCRSVSQLHSPSPFFSPLKVRHHFFTMFSVFYASSFCLKIFMCHSFTCRVKHLSEASITHSQLTRGHKGDLFHINNLFPFIGTTRISSTFSVSLSKVQI